MKNPGIISQVSLKGIIGILVPNRCKYKSSLTLLFKKSKALSHWGFLYLGHLRVPILML